MALDFYLLRNDNKTAFNLGRNCWTLMNDDDWVYDKHILLERLVVLYMENPNLDGIYHLYLRDKIWDFLQGIKTEEDLEIVTEHYLYETPNFDYEIVGERYATEEGWKETISKKYLS